MSKVIYDHKAGSIYKACGIKQTPELVERVHNVVDTLTSFDKSSEVIEFILSNLEDEAVRFFTIHMITKGLESIKEES